MRRAMKMIALCFALAVIVRYCSDTVHAELIVNGDFSSGNTGFSSDYTNGQAGPGGYVITTNPHSIDSNQASFGDHTTGSGNMLFVDGGPTGNRVWYETISVTPNTSYDFSAWMASSINANNAKLRFTANGTALASDLLLGGAGNWQHFEASWFSGSNTSVQLSVYDVNTNVSGFGNDFALDDFSFNAQAVPEPSSLLLAAGCISGYFGARRLRNRRVADVADGDGGIIASAIGCPAAAPGGRRRTK